MTTCDWTGCSTPGAGASAWCADHCPLGWTVESFSPLGPGAKVKRSDSGVVEIAWSSRGGTRPARETPVLRFTNQGTLKKAKWLRGTKLSRVDGPAEVAIGRYGGWIENYYLDGALHRDGGPAAISFFPDGSVEGEWFFVHDRSHRLDGPAWTVYRADGSVDRPHFAVEGIELAAEEFASYTEAVAGGAMHEWALAFALGEVG